MEPDRDKEIIRTLVAKVPFLSFEQVARTWWNPKRSGFVATRARLSKIIEQGWLYPVHQEHLPKHNLTEPLLVWEAGDEDPTRKHLGELAYHIQKRFKGRLKQTTLYLLGKEAARVFGELLRIKLLDHIIIGADGYY